MGDESPAANADNPYAGDSVNYAGEAANSASQRAQYTAAPVNTPGRQAASASISGKNRPVVAKIGKKPAATAANTNYAAPNTNYSDSRQPDSRQTAVAGNRTAVGVSPEESEAKDKKESGSLFSFFGFGSDKSTDKSSDKSSDKSEKTKKRNSQNEAELAQQGNGNKNSVRLPDARDEELYTDKSGWWKLRPRKAPDSSKTGNRVVAEQLDVPAASASLASPSNAANSSSSAQLETRENVASQTPNPYSNLNGQPGQINGAAGNVAGNAAGNVAGNASQNSSANPYAASYSTGAGTREAVQSTGGQPANASSNPYSATAIAATDSRSDAAATDSGNPYAAQTVQAPPRVSRSSSSANVNPYANMTGAVRPTFSADMGNSFAGQTVPRNPYEGIANSAANGNSDIQMPALPKSGAAFAAAQDSTVRRLPPTADPSTAVAINNNSSINPMANLAANQMANQSANNSLASTGADPSLPPLPSLPGDESKTSDGGYSASEGTARQNIPDTAAVAATSPDADIPPLPGIPPLPDIPQNNPAAADNAAGNLAANGAVNSSAPGLPPNPMAATTAAPGQFIASSAEGLDEKALEASNESTRLYSAAGADPETIATNDSQAANWRNQMRASDVPGMSKNFVPVEGAKVWAKV